MRSSLRRAALFLAAYSSFQLLIPGVFAQSNTGTVSGSVTDPTGAVVSGSTVSLQNPVSGYQRSTTTDPSGHFQFTNLPFNPYRENDSTFHTDVDRSLFQKAAAGKPVLFAEFAGDAVFAGRRGRLERPVPRPGRSRFELVFGRRPADHRPAEQGLLEPDSVELGAVDGGDLRRAAGRVWRQDQPGDPGDDALRAGRHEAHGKHHTSYGSFGSATGGIDLSYGGENWGNFFEVDGLNTGRFLDPPEFVVFHDKGNEQNVFDRVDRSFHGKDSVRLNLNYSRSWFQTPNAYDNLNVQNVIERRRDGQSGLRQRGQYRSALEDRDLQHCADLHARDWHAMRSSTLALCPARRYNYYPSGNPLADLGAAESAE
jgi:hypothetical protein